MHQSAITSARRDLQEALTALRERRAPHDALPVCQRVLAQLEDIGCRSAFVHLQLAIVYDLLGRTEEALTQIDEAAALDPLDPAIVRSYDIIIENIRKYVGDPARGPGDPLVARFYERLLTRGETDDACHLAIARAYEAAGRREDADRILAAMTTINPSCLEAWAQVEAIAVGRSDVGRARRARAEVLARTTGVPLVVKD